MIVEENISKKIIASGYFANQIPCEFNSITLGDNIDKLDLSKSKLSKNGFNKWCKLIDFSIPKGENFRRVLSIPHPLHYILLAQLIEEKWIELESHFSKSQFSLTAPQIAEDSIIPKYKMSEKINRRIHNLVLKRYILQADISRYYPSIYTHSIAWALHTKEIAKAEQKNDGYFGNVIDRLIRNMQDGQTVGIPIGPIISLIIQEIIGTEIDYEFKREYGDGLLGYRYTDDMEYYFNTLEEAERALNILNKILKNYGLDLNNSKTKIIKIPQVLEPEWVYYFKKYEFRSNKKDRKKSIDLQQTDIKEFFSMAFKYKIQSDEKGILNYAVKVLRSVVIYEENWDVFESLLLQSILVDSSIIPTVFETIEGYKYRGYKLNYKKLKDFINILIKGNIEVKNDFEVAWALSFASKLDISIEEEVSKLLLKSDNAIINILVMILNSKKILEGDLDFSYYETLLTKESFYDSSWLFYYECCVHGWLGKNKSDQYLKNDKFFEQLLGCDISFVNPMYSKVVEEVKNSIISLCIKHYRTNMKTLEAQDIMSKIIKEYSFSLKAEIIDELNDKVEYEISKMIVAEDTEESEVTGKDTEESEVTGKDTEESEVTDKETEESEVTDKETEESEVTGKRTEGSEVTNEDTEESKEQSNKNDWLFNFLTTKINGNNRIRTFNIYEEY